jgi:GMP synthase-like glutamine amidotransferase
MIVLVDLEHERLAEDRPERAVTSMAGRLKVKYRLEDISGQPCLIVRWNRMSPALLESVGAQALVVSGNSTEFEHYPETQMAGLRAVLRAGMLPTLAFCGGCHILAETHGAAVGPIGPLPAGVPNPYPELDYAPGMLQERGFTPIQVYAAHPIFDGLGECPVMLESHYWEVKAVPAGFAAYASTDICRIQMLAHEHLPLYATQFHPEFFDEKHPDGRIFLANFFRLAGILPEHAFAQEVVG